jgi:hypothetical protein
MFLSVRSVRTDPGICPLTRTESEISMSVDSDFKEPLILKKFINRKDRKGKAKIAKNTIEEMMTENELSNKIIGLAIEVHQVLGPGLLESAYKECLYNKIIRSGLIAEKEKPMPLVFEEVKLDCG